MLLLFALSLSSGRNGLGTGFFRLFLREQFQVQSDDLPRRSSERLFELRATSRSLAVLLMQNISRAKMGDQPIRRCENHPFGVASKVGRHVVTQPVQGRLPDRVDGLGRQESGS